MADVLVWVMERRVVLEERAEQLCKELAGTEAEVVSLEAAGRFAAAMLVAAFVAPTFDRACGGARACRERRWYRASCLPTHVPRRDYGDVAMRVLLPLAPDGYGFVSDS
ncbi:hypothetical protein [Streptomyces sp. NPDC059970]|uniref:hypothetical protein n=1 Tax=Streptomyces sp. NPDC059970 TaxID=3347019 RepID=UPI003688A7C3